MAPADRAVRAALLAAALALPGAAAAHPHVWIQAEADFVLDTEGRLERLRITWVYDAFASLYMVGALGIDADADQKMTPEDAEAVIADQLTWPPEFAGDSHLKVAGAARALGQPENASARFTDLGEIALTYDRTLAEPVRPGSGEAAAVLKLYDPTYFFSYEVAADPALIGEGPGCGTRRLPPDSEGRDLEALAVQLAELDRSETPAEEGVGAYFAERLVLTCG